MEWTIQDLGAVGELMGAIAVVITIGYLASQIRQNTRSTRAMTYAASTGGWQDTFQEMSVEDYDLFVQAAIDDESLTDGQFLRTYYLFRAIFRRIENDFYQYKAGTLDQATWEAYTVSFVDDFFATRVPRAMWKLQSGYFEPSCAAYIDGMVDRATAQGATNLRAQFSGLIRGG